MTSNTRIYLDNAATTPILPAVREAMLPFLEASFGNASTLYALGRESRAAIDEARRSVAELIGANPDEIAFTSGGTESDNWALLGVALANLEKKGHFVLSSIEHHAVLEVESTLRALGFDVDIARCNSWGCVAPDEIERLLRPDTVLVSVMAVNNETGAMQLVEGIGLLCHAKGVLFHCDAVQAAGKIPIDVQAWSADLLSLSAHKIGGPKGTGALYIKRGTPMRALICGGAQERGRRAGTENVAGIAGFGAACAAAHKNLQANADHICELRKQLEKSLQEIDGVQINGDHAPRAPHITNFSVPDCRADTLAFNLDLQGFAVGTGSACASGAVEPSHVLTAMGVDEETAFSSIRVSLGAQNTHPEICEFLNTLKQCID